MRKRLSKFPAARPSATARNALGSGEGTGGYAISFNLMGPDLKQLSTYSLKMLEQFQEECDNDKLWFTFDLGLLVRAMVVFARFGCGPKRLITLPLPPPIKGGGIDLQTWGWRSPSLDGRGQGEGELLQSAGQIGCRSGSDH